MLLLRRRNAGNERPYIYDVVLSMILRCNVCIHVHLFNTLHLQTNVSAGVTVSRTLMQYCFNYNERANMNISLSLRVSFSLFNGSS